MGEDGSEEEGSGEQADQGAFPVNCAVDKPWTHDEVKTIFLYYKLHGTNWSVIAERFPGRTSNSIKNKFYTTLKRVATCAQLEDPAKYPPTLVKCKKNLLQFVDLAIRHAEKIPSKRGRKCNNDRLQVTQNHILFPHNEEQQPDAFYSLPAPIVPLNFATPFLVPYCLPVSSAVPMVNPQVTHFYKLA